MKRKIYLMVFLFLLPPSVLGKIVHYELIGTRGKINLSGKKTVDFALMLNGQIPAPTLEFTEGDEAEIVVKNLIPGEELSVHWHGILLPPEMDGVPYVNTPPIYSGGEFTFRFKIRQHGTYWYHSHTDVQEQKGIYGAIVIHPKKETIKYDKEVVAVLSDWSDENPTQILKNLRKDGDYYNYKKDTVRSIFGAIGAKSLNNYLYNEWTRMGGMDLSDVGYDAFLINGKRDSQLVSAHPGEKIRIRIINASASTYFYVALGQKAMKVISDDGVDIKPIFAKEILTAVAETHDLIFEVPDHKNYELRVTAQDGTGYVSAWIGMGEKVHAPIRPYPDLYAKMSHGGSTSGNSPHSQHGEKPQKNDQTEMKSVSPQHHKHQGHAASKVGTPGSSISEEVDVLTVDNIQSPNKTELPKKPKIQNLKLVLSGDMSRYVWHINGKAIFEDYALGINEGDVVRITYENQTMMHHPMHLHGHFFRVINKYGAYSPLKHTVDVPPHSTRVIEFYADEPGEWMLHCHNLYHLKTGMARVVKYRDFVPKPEIAKHQKHDPHLHDHWYDSGTVEVATNHYQIYLSTSQTWNQIEARFESRNALPGSIFYQGEWEYEGDLFYRRWFGNYFNLIGGGTYFSWTPYAVVGVGYILPMLIETNVLVTQNGKFRLDLDKRIQWSKNFLTDITFTYRPDQEKKFSQAVEWEISLYYAPAWSWAAGLMFTNRDIGAGVQVWF